jgi:hypothetical protein
MTAQDLFNTYLNWWVVTVPLTLHLIFKIVPEILDAFYARRVNKMLSHSDKMDVVALESVYMHQKMLQIGLNRSNLIQAKRQADFQELLSKKWRLKKDEPEHERIINSATISYIFKG